MQVSAAYSVEKPTKITVSKYSILGIIYFFFNSVFLPKGLLYTNLLSPVFYYNVVKNKRKTYVVHFVSFLLVYDLIHLYLGVDYKSFVISNGLFISTYFCVISFYHFINNYEQLAKLYKQILLFNAVLVIIAIPFFFAPKYYQEFFWYFNKFTKGVSNFPRLALFTYEASYYSLLLVPIFYYYGLKFLFNTFHDNKWFTISLVIVPLLLSLSFGVLGTTLATAFIMGLVFWKKLVRYKRTFIFLFSSIAIIIAAIVFLSIYFPSNALFIRIENILAGNDTSANGRTIDSITMAWRIADLKNIFFGAGLGQIKIMATEVAHKYYKYWGNLSRYDIPNTLGETLAIFGVTGVILRFFIEIYLFFKTKVYQNYYRLSLFIFAFLYQFTGSYITNIVEYVIWILAFSSVFKQFDINRSNA